MPADVRGMHIFNVSARAFSLRWEQALGCVDRYSVTLQPSKGRVILHPARDGYIQVQEHGAPLDPWRSAFQVLCTPVNKTGKAMFSWTMLEQANLALHDSTAELTCTL